MPDPAEKCTNCGARFDEHTHAIDGGYDCPPRADGKVPIVVRHNYTSYAVDEVYATPVIEWRDPEPPEPKDALDVLRMGQEGRGA